MSLENFEQKSIQSEQESIESVKNQLNRSFAGVWDKNNARLDGTDISSPEEVLSVMEADRLRVERLHNAFNEVDQCFTIDKITCPNDAKELPLSTIESLINDKPVEESCAIASYFLANKIALSRPVTVESLRAFKDSEERAQMVSEVRGVLSKTASWSEWAEDLGGYAAGAVSDLSDGVQNGVAVLAENVSELASEANETFEVGLDAVVNGTAEVATVASEVAQATAEVVVDSAEAVCYVTQRAAVGGIAFAENCSDYVVATVSTLTGNEDSALDTVQTSIADELSARIDEYYDPSDTLKSIGDVAETVGEIATGVGLTVAAIANVPTSATLLGSSALATATAGTSIALLGTNAAGNALEAAVDVTGEIGAKELTAATVAGVAVAGATAAAGVINSQIPRFVAQSVAARAAANNITVNVGGRLVGTLASSAIAAADVGLFRVADVATDLSNVALGIEENFDVISELQETVFSVAGAGLVAGAGYNLFRAIQGLRTENYTDYFDQLYRSELGNYGREIFIRIPEGWDSEQIAQAQAKVDALADAAQAGELARTPVERTGSASSRYIQEYGPNSIPNGMDVDHTIELQLGGSNDISNLNPIDSSVNRSFGSQIRNQIRNIPYGAPITNISFI